MEQRSARLPVTQEVVGSNPIGDAFKRRGTQTGKATDDQTSFGARPPRHVCRFDSLPRYFLQTPNSQVVEPVDTRHSECRAHRGVRVQLSPWLLFRNNIAGATGVQLIVIRSVCSARYRDLQLQCKQHRGWASAQPGLISQDRRVRPPDPLLRWSSTQTEKRLGREPSDFVGSTPISTTSEV